MVAQVTFSGPAALDLDAVGTDVLQQAVGDPGVVVGEQQIDPGEPGVGQMQPGQVDIARVRQPDRAEPVPRHLDLPVVLGVLVLGPGVTTGDPAVAVPADEVGVLHPEPVERHVVQPVLRRRTGQIQHGLHRRPQYVDAVHRAAARLVVDLAGLVVEVVLPRLVEEAERVLEEVPGAAVAVDHRVAGPVLQRRLGLLEVRVEQRDRVGEPGPRPTRPDRHRRLAHVPARIPVAGLARRASCGRPSCPLRRGPIAGTATRCHRSHGSDSERWWPASRPRTACRTASTRRTSPCRYRHGSASSR